MADVKWIKIVTDIFDDEKFSIIDAMPEADAIELIWFKLLVFAGKSNNNGIFFFNDRIAYTDEMLANVFHRPLNTVRLALQTFINLGMIEEIDGVYTITNWEKHQSLDAYEKKKLRDREYQQKRREQAKNQIENKKSSDNRLTVGRDCSYSISNSYSYSNNSNISNFNYILENTKDEYIEYVIGNHKVYDIIYAWLDYKDGKKPKSSNHYDTERSLKTLIKKFVESARQYGFVDLEKVVDDSIAGNYQGIVWDKLATRNNKKGDKPSDRRVEDSITGDIERDRELEEYIHSAEFLNDDGKLF